LVDSIFEVEVELVDEVVELVDVDAEVVVSTTVVVEVEVVDSSHIHLFHGQTTAF